MEAAMMDFGKHVRISGSFAQVTSPYYADNWFWLVWMNTSTQWRARILQRTKETSQRRANVRAPHILSLHRIVDIGWLPNQLHSCQIGPALYRFRNDAIRR